MSRNRIVYLNWIVDLGYDPSSQGFMEIWREGETELVSLDTPGAKAIRADKVSRETETSRSIRQHVTCALESLSVEEREFIERFYLMGRTYREMSEKTGRAIHKLEALHKRALRKLKKELRPFVQERWQLETKDGKTSSTDCPVCRSSQRDEIDKLIASRDHTQTWRPILRKLREQYGLIIRSPQILIGHEKYHSRNIY